jgi:hypothetical protein
MVCLPEADDCGGECTDLSWDVRNCGSCSNQCASHEICCAGNCVSRESAERFCDFCGFQGGWPQGCNDDEVCNGGLCLPVATDPSGGEQAGAEPAAVAEQLSVLESQGAFDALYDRLHPDAQITVPRGVVTYWYSQYFAPLGPQPITVTGVDYADWTWEVIGRTYPGTAIVNYTQPLSNAAPVDEVVRLVQDVDGAWRWFFGRSEAFVEEMTAAAQTAGAVDSAESIPDAAGMPPAALFAEALSAIDSVSPACLDIISLFESAPSSLQGAEKQELTQDSGGDGAMFSYLPSDRAAGEAYPDLIIRSRALNAGESPGSVISDIEESIVNWDGPEFSLPPRALYVDLAPASLYLVSFYEEYTELLGHVPVLTWAERGGNILFAVTGPSIVAANELLATWAATLLTSSPGCGE